MVVTNHLQVLGWSSKQPLQVGAYSSLWELESNLPISDEETGVFFRDLGRAKKPTYKNPINEMCNYVCLPFIIEVL